MDIRKYQSDVHMIYTGWDKSATDNMLITEFWWWNAEAVSIYNKQINGGGAK